MWKLEGERRVATVILADVRSSTDLMEQIGTEAWVEIMNRVLQILEAEIYRFGGQVDQFRGDGLVAFFGAASAHEDDPERAILAALSMQYAIQPYGAELADHRGIDLKLRVGVNTGEVIVTSVGDSSQYREDTAMGEAVALASRMETAAEPGTILVSGNTYRLVESNFRWQPLGEIMVKGISHPIPVYRPLGPQPDSEWSRDLMAYGVQTQLTGRTVEFQILQGSIEDLYGGRGGIVMLTGENGMGKSFLVTHVRHHFARQGALLAGAHSDKPASTVENPPYSTMTWLQGACRSYGQTWPYSMWLDMLQRWSGMRPDDPPEESRDRLHCQSEALWGDHLDMFYPYLATFLSLPLEEAYVERVRHLDAGGLQRQFFLAVRSLIEGLLKSGPLVLAFNDMQWADASSLDLLRYCLSLCDSEALLWIMVYRSDRTSPVWNFRHLIETDYPHRLTSIELSSLTNEDSRELIEQTIGRDALSEQTCALVIQKAEGNPYYIREIIHNLVDQGVLVRDAETGKWNEARMISSLDLPDSLQSLLLERIDRLSPEERRVLQMAAVIGPVFWHNALQALSGEKVPLKTHLTALEREQLIQERNQIPALGMEYAFNSSLIRDAAYESLLSPQRTTYHLKTAEFLENSVGLEGWVQLESLIASHYRYAGNPNRELFYTLRAAEQAKKVYANAEAYRHYTRALELLDAMDAQATTEEQHYAICTQRFEVLSGRGEMCYRMGDIQAGEEDARALFPLARQMADDPAWLVDALLGQPEVDLAESRDEVGSGLAMAQEALALAQQMGDRHREMRSLSTIARLRALLREPGALEAAERSLELARQLGDLRMEVALLLGIGSTYGMDNLERSREYLEKALSISQQLDDKGIEIDLLEVIGGQYERSGDYHRLLLDYQQKRLQISREIGNRLAEGNALMFCAQIQGLYLGDYEAGLAQAEEALHLWEETTDRLFPLLRVAQIQIVQRKLEQAMATLDLARPLSVQNVWDLGRAGFALVSAILYNALGDEAHLHQVLELAARFEQMMADKLVSRQYQMAAACEATAAHLALADYLTDNNRGQEHLSQALESSRMALSIYEQYGFVQVVECTSEEILYRHSLALKANKNRTESRELLKCAYDEMMRKHDLIPADSSFRRTYLENIALHREILNSYNAAFKRARG
jgi:class 3 adenylate cyclase